MRYRHLRRTAIAVLAAVAFVLLLGLLVRQLLNTSQVRDKVTDWAERLAAERGLDLQIATMQWGVMPPRIVLLDVTLTDTEFAIQIDRLEVELSRIRVARRIIELRTVAAEGIRLRLEGTPRPRQDRGESLLRVVVHHLDLRDIAFEGNDLPGKIDVEVDGADVAWTTQGGTPAGFFSVARARMTASSLEPIEVSLRSRLLIDEGIRFPAWHLAGDGLSLTGTGSIADGALRLQAVGTIDLDRVSTAVHNPGLIGGTCPGDRHRGHQPRRSGRHRGESTDGHRGGLSVRGRRRPHDDRARSALRRPRRRQLPRRSRERHVPARAPRPGRPAPTGSSWWATGCRSAGS